MSAKLSTVRRQRSGVQDLWLKRDGTPTKLDGRGLRWRAVYVDRDGRQRTRAFAEHADARAWLRDTPDAVEFGRYVPDPHAPIPTADGPGMYLYRLYAGDDLLYVGITKDCDKRWAEHAKDKHWWPDVTRRTREWFPDRLPVEIAEIRAIKHEHPRYNIVHSVTPRSEPVSRTKSGFTGNPLQY